MSILEVDPNDYIITRKRKKYKFALFANSPICFELQEWHKKIDPEMAAASRNTTFGMVADATIPRVTPLVFREAAAISGSLSLELGAGTGLFSVELAVRHPDQMFIAVDVKADRLQKGAGEAAERCLTNIVFVRARADQLDQIVSAGSLASLWITFPDPFPKKRAAGRRMTHPRYIKIYEKLLRPDGALYLKHDNRQFFNWSLEQLVAERWHIDELSFDLHDSDLSDDYKIKTTYETRWLDEGLVTNFVKAIPPKAYLLK